jgi:hypothetical protein
MYKLFVILIVFILGLYFISKSNDIETFTHTSRAGTSRAGTSEGKTDADNKIAENCPDVLIQKGSALYLYNSKRGNVPGINPIQFANLEEYVEFTDWQRSQGILCPVLFLQHAFNAQGDAVLKARPSPTNLQGGLPDYYVDQNSLPDIIASNMNIMPPPKSVPVHGFNPSGAASIGAASVGTDIANIGVTSAYDPQNQDIGLETPLDKMFNANSNTVSPNPMDHNWGGVEFTENLIKSGFYKGSEVSRNTVLF